MTAVFEAIVIDFMGLSTWLFLVSDPRASGNFGRPGLPQRRLRFLLVESMPTPPCLWIRNAKWACLVHHFLHMLSLRLYWTDEVRDERAVAISINAR